jgi:hypothetical protein
MPVSQRYFDIDEGQPVLVQEALGGVPSVDAFKQKRFGRIQKAYNIARRSYLLGLAGGMIGLNIVGAMMEADDVKLHHDNIMVGPVRLDELQLISMLTIVRDEFDVVPGAGLSSEYGSIGHEPWKVDALRWITTDVPVVTARRVVRGVLHDVPPYERLILGTINKMRPKLIDDAVRAMEALWEMKQNGSHAAAAQGMST